MRMTASNPHRLAKVVLLGTLVLAQTATSNAFAQQGTSSFSLAAGRAGLVPIHPDAVFVEEYVNYHHHDIALPEERQSVGLDVRIANLSRPEGGESILQIGLSTDSIVDKAQMPPLNIALVIDTSGSMQGERIDNVKKSILAFVNKLRSSDQVAIIAFNQEAHVVMSAGESTDIDAIHNVIETIVAGGSTNMHAGLMQGYEAVLRNYDKQKTNRVILLTDGRANAGVTDPEDIVNQSREYNEKGVDLSTIGLGNDVNHRLLRQLAKAGRGLIHFVDDGKDIRKVFMQELDSLLSPVARAVQLDIEYASALRLLHLYGYQPQFGEHSIRLPLDNLNSGVTQVILARFLTSKRQSALEESQIAVRLSYLDIRTQTTVHLQRVVSVEEVGNGDQAADVQTDPEVTKNFSIAEMAQAIKEMARRLQTNDLVRAQEALEQSMRNVKRRYVTIEDEDVLRVYRIAEDYAKKTAAMRRNLEDLQSR